jgi:hypothetical protein
MKKGLGNMCAGVIKGSVADDVVWYGWEDICDKHGTIDCHCEKTAETEWPPVDVWDENEPF